MIISRRLGWAEYVAKMEKGRIALKMLMGKPIGKPRYRWEGNIRMDLIEVSINMRNCIDSAQDLRLEIIREPL